MPSKRGASKRTLPADVRWNAGITAGALVVAIVSWLAGNGSLGISSLAVAAGMGLGTAFDLRKAVRVDRSGRRDGGSDPDR